MPIVPNQSSSSWGNPSIWTGRKAWWRRRMFWINPVKGPYYILLSQRIDKVRQISNHNWLLLFQFWFIFIFILSFFNNLFSLSCYCQQASWCSCWLAQGSFFNDAYLRNDEDDWLVAAKSLLVQYMFVAWQEHQPRCLSQREHSFLLQRKYVNTLVRWAVGIHCEAAWSFRLK